MKDWLDGPKLYEWVLTHLEGTPPGAISESFERAMNHWKAGTNPSYYTADHWLIKIGIWENDIPEDFWIDPPERTPPTNHAPQVREEALKKIDKGASLKTIAEELGINERTLRGWKAGKNVRSMLQPEQREEIRARFIRKSPKVSNAKELGEEFGVTPDRIRIIARAK